MKILLDMNMSPRWAKLLTDAGFDTTHWSKLGLAYAEDPEIVRFAAEQGYVILTKDLDFGEILASTNAKLPSVIQLRAGNLRPEMIGQQVILALLRTELELEQGALVTVDPKKTRVRVLPLQPRD